MRSLAAMFRVTAELLHVDALPADDQLAKPGVLFLQLLRADVFLQFGHHIPGPDCCLTGTSGRCLLVERESSRKPNKWVCLFFRGRPKTVGFPFGFPLKPQKTLKKTHTNQNATQLKSGNDSSWHPG